MSEEKCWICRSEERKPVLDIRTQATIGFKTVRKNATLVKVIVKCCTNGNEWEFPIMKCVDCIAYTKQLEMMKEIEDDYDDEVCYSKTEERAVCENAEANRAGVVGALPELRKEEKDTGQ